MVEICQRGVRADRKWVKICSHCTGANRKRIDPNRKQTPANLKCTGTGNHYYRITHIYSAFAKYEDTRRCKGQNELSLGAHLKGPAIKGKELKL